MPSEESWLEVDMPSGPASKPQPAASAIAPHSAWCRCRRRDDDAVVETANEELHRRCPARWSPHAGFSEHRAERGVDRLPVAADLESCLGDDAVDNHGGEVEVFSPSKISMYTDELLPGVAPCAYGG